MVGELDERDTPRSKKLTEARGIDKRNNKNPATIAALVTH
jgi:hypothetical protein